MLKRNKGQQLDQPRPETNSDLLEAYKAKDGLEEVAEDFSEEGEEASEEEDE